jgi:hypothetical protein
VATSVAAGGDSCDGCRPWQPGSSCDAQQLEVFTAQFSDFGMNCKRLSGEALASAALVIDRDTDAHNSEIFTNRCCVNIGQLAAASRTPMTAHNLHGRANLRRLFHEDEAEELAVLLDSGGNESVWAWFRQNYPNTASRWVKEHRGVDFAALVRGLYESEPGAPS